MEHLHVKLKIVHRNLRGKNIFVREEGIKIRIFVGGFENSIHGLSRNNDSNSFEIGARGWMVGFFKKKYPFR